MQQRDRAGVRRPFAGIGEPFQVGLRQVLDPVAQFPQFAAVDEYDDLFRLITAELS